jgi:hypothetical protein
MIEGYYGIYKGWKIYTNSDGTSWSAARGSAFSPGYNSLDLLKTWIDSSTASSIQQETYGYEWKVQLRTAKGFFKDDPFYIGDAALDGVVSNVKQQAEHEILNQMASYAQQQGVHITITAINSVCWAATEWYKDPDTGHSGDAVFIYDYITVDFVSDVAFLGSPIAPELLLVIKMVITYIVLAIVAYFAIQALKDWLTSMTTTSSQVNQTTVTVTKNPDGSTTTTTTTTTENTQQPSTTGIIAVAAGLGILALVVGGLYLASKAGSRRR